MDHLKKHASTEGGTDGEDEAKRNEDEEVDLEFGIPPHVIKEIEVEARRKLGLNGPS